MSAHSRFLPDSSSNALAVLKRARARIATPETWTRHFGARNAANRACHVRDREAVRWCLLGAVAAEGGSVTAFETLRQHGGRNLAELNDTTSHAAVLRIVDRSIATLQAVLS